MGRGGGGGWVGKGGRAKCSARGLVISVSYAQVPDLDQHQLDDDVLLVCVLLPAFVSSADAGGERSGQTDRHAHPAVSPRPASHTNTQTTHQPPPVRQIHKHIFSTSAHAPTQFSGPIFLLSSPPLVWASCKISPILAKLLLLAYISSNSICTVCAKNTILDFIANLICKKHPDIADSPLVSASSQLMEGPISM